MTPPVTPLDATAFDPNLVLAVLSRATRYGDMYWTPTTFVLSDASTHAGFRATFGPWEVALDEDALVLLVRPIDVAAQSPPCKIAQGIKVKQVLDAVHTARARPTIELFARHCRSVR